MLSTINELLTNVSSDRVDRLVSTPPGWAMQTQVALSSSTTTCLRPHPGACHTNIKKQDVDDGMDNFRPTLTIVACCYTPGLSTGPSRVHKLVLPQRTLLDSMQSCIWLFARQAGRAWRRVSHGWRSQLKAGNQDSSTRRNSRSRYSCTLQARHVSFMGKAHHLARHSWMLLGTHAWSWP